MIQTVNISTLKDQLSGYLKDVQRGDVVLVTDRGNVVAEIRQPMLQAMAMTSAQARVQQLVDSGALRLGLGNDPSAYQPSGVRLSGDLVDAALNETRGEGSE